MIAWEKYILAIPVQPTGLRHFDALRTMALHKSFYAAPFFLGLFRLERDFYCSSNTCREPAGIVLIGFICNPDCLRPCNDFPLPSR